MPTVLITQCLQRDFVEPLESHGALPNALHVGADEARRLLGVEPDHGPLAHLMQWARDEAAGGRLHIVHVRDWHDADDPRQAEHLERFGRHCVQGTRGAELVLDLERTQVQHEVLVDAIGLSDFEETTLRDELDRIARTAPGEPMRVAVIGVWTDAKVTFLLYDLRTRAGVEELATCSALTASPSRAAHFSALEQARRLLGVKVCDSVGELAAFLVPDGRPVEPVRLQQTTLPRIECEPPERGPTDDDAVLVGYLLRQATRISLHPLSGGFSGAAVYRAEAFDALGHALAPSVIKVGPSALIGKERVAFEQVEGILGNHAPTVRGFADLGGRAAIRYAFASMGSGRVRTFKSLFESDPAPDALRYVLEQTFDVVLGRFEAAAMYERLGLLEYYGFDPKWATNVRARVAAVGGVAVGADEVPVAGQPPRPNVACFYENLGTLPGLPGESHYVSWVHGDLNGANILVDARENVWVIDFFHAHRGHVLRDLAKLENDILYLMTPLLDEAHLEQHVRMTDQLNGVADLRAPLPEFPDAIDAPALLRTWRTVAMLRAIGAGYAREDRDPYQLRVPLLRYAVHTLSFEEASPLQKRAALSAACGLAATVRGDLERNRALRIDVVAQQRVPGRLGVTICPGRRDRGRVLRDDVASIQRWGASLLVTFVTDDELAWAGVADLVHELERAGVQALRLPIPDQRVPTTAEARHVVDAVRAALERGRGVVLACMGGLGRSGMLAATTLVDLGINPDFAIRLVRDARGPRAVETSVQEAFVRDWVPGTTSAPYHDR